MRFASLKFAPLRSPRRGRPAEVRPAKALGRLGSYFNSSYIRYRLRPRPFRHISAKFVQNKIMNGRL